MPIYEYECVGCGIRFERKQSFSDDPVRECPECQGQTRRVLFPVGIIFKGSGFYITDSKGSSAGSITGEESPTGVKEDSGKSEKQEAKAEAKATAGKAED